jgi:formamidopyrimidine-DNA glycosylase
MPELPEVETMRLGLEKYLVGKTILSVDVRTQSIFSGDPNLLIGAEVVTVRRKGKGLIIDLSNGFSLAVHVKMTGQLVYRKNDKQKTINNKNEAMGINFHPSLGIAESLPNKHTHVIFTLRTKNQDQGTKLYYNDIRKFGWMQVVETEEALSLPFFRALGPDPLSNLSIEQFNNIVHVSHAPIKSVLMDQSKIAGVGNIYANEALFEAKIDPRKPAKQLRKKEQQALFSSLIHVLTLGLQFGGASDNTYIKVDGTQGSFQHHFQVYRRHGQACPICGSTIERIVVGGRGTFLCSTCQK